MRGGPGQRGNNNNNNNNGPRIFDNVDFDDLPGSSTRRNGNYGPYGRGGGASGGIGGDPYDRGLDSDFINGGSGRNVRGIGGGRRDTTEIGGPDADFNRRGPPGLQQMRGNNNINNRGGGGRRRTAPNLPARLSRHPMKNNSKRDGSSNLNGKVNGFETQCTGNHANDIFVIGCFSFITYKYIIKRVY